RERGGGELEEAPSVDPGGIRRFGLRELVGERGEEGLVARRLLEAAPLKRGAVLGQAATQRREVGRRHRWHVEQSASPAGRTSFSRIRVSPTLRGSPAGCQSRSKTRSRGRRLGAGSRWQARHQPIVSGFALAVSRISSMRPWQVTQPTPFATWIEWSK